MYRSIREDDVFVIYNDNSPLVTPMGNPVETGSKALANRLVKDLKKFGEDPASADSLVTFHYSLLDFFRKTPRAILEENVALGLDSQNDWTMHCPTATPEPMMKWMSLFGSPKVQIENGTKWLASLTLGQLCAVCVLGQAVESVNIPYIVATKLGPGDVGRYTHAVTEFYPYVGAPTLRLYFENYLFYYGCFLHADSAA